MKSPPVAYPETITPYVAKQVTTLCEQDGTRLSELAFCLNVDRRCLSALMNGTQDFTIPQLWMVSMYFNVGIEYFFPRS